MTEIEYLTSEFNMYSFFHDGMDLNEFKGWKETRKGKD